MLTWSAVLAKPELANLPYKIELEIDIAQQLQ
jgi:hypothetical protein